MSRQHHFLALSGAAALLATSAFAARGGDDTTPTATAAAKATPAAPTAAKATTAATKGATKLDNATTTASGLQYVDTVVGSGASPRADQQVTVNYTGKLASNGQVFDSTTGKQPATFPMNGVIKGFAEGISTMKVGGKRTVYIPSALGYGASGTPGGPIPPNADLIFDIELIAIK